MLQAQDGPQPFIGGVEAWRPCNLPLEGFGRVGEMSVLGPLYGR